MLWETFSLQIIVGAVHSIALPRRQLGFDALRNLARGLGLGEGLVLALVEGLVLMPVGRGLGGAGTKPPIPQASQIHREMTQKITQLFASCTRPSPEFTDSCVLQTEGNGWWGDWGRKSILK